MPFINAASRKRARSNSRPFFRRSTTAKMPRLDSIPVDGAGSRKSMESTSTTGHRVSNLKNRIKRGSSHVKTFFGLGTPPGHEHHKLEDTVSSFEKHGSHTSFRSLQPSSATMIVRPLRLTLTGAALTNDRTFLQDLPNAIQASENSLAVSAPLQTDIDHNRNRSSSIRRSQSVPGLTHKLSHKLQETFGHPTVKHKSSLRSRPSVHSVTHGDEVLGQIHSSTATQASSPSTLYSQNHTSPYFQDETTPLTSDGLTVSPQSMKNTVNMPPFDMSKAITLFNTEMERRRLSPISEAPMHYVSTIVTVEATANAKIFFETHFNSVLSGTTPRSLRRKQFEKQLESLHLPSEMQNRARKAWQRQESNQLRQERILRTKTRDRTPLKGVSVAGYEVVRVLGKGSFGVVRLVKDTPETAADKEILQQPEKFLGLPIKPSRADLKALKASAKEAMRSTSTGKRDLTQLKKEVYAMKVIRKSAMIRNSQEGHIRAERDFLVASEGSRWIISLITAFQDSRHLYLVMDFCIGGDFLGLLIRKTILTEEVTRWYIAEMILCVEEAHRMRWIHRDVKPDNFLIGADGHLKVSDFGLAFDGEWSHDQSYFHKHRHSLVGKLGIEVEGDDEDQIEKEQGEKAERVSGLLSRRPSKSPKKPKVEEREESPTGEPLLDWRNRQQRRNLAKSVVGTSQYMAPEVIRGELYDGRCDWWSIGIIMYECLYGYTPFACENRQDTKLRILKHQTTLEFPETPRNTLPVSFHAVDLMMSILQEKEQRLCSRRYRHNDYVHRMMQGLPQLPTLESYSKDLNGHFVYPDDAEDIKKHRFFRTIPWEDIHLRRPPFVPRVKSWEDTKYFDDDDQISDMSQSSEDEGDRHLRNATLVNVDVEVADGGVAIPLTGSRISQHQQEDQKIIPSFGMQTTKTLEQIGQTKIPNPLMIPLSEIPKVTNEVEGMFGATPPVATQGFFRVEKSKKRRREKKRPRDKILRDAECAKTAMEMRKRGAFLGYGYRRPKRVDEVLRECLGNVGEADGGEDGKGMGKGSERKISGAVSVGVPMEFEERIID